MNNLKIKTTRKWHKPLTFSQLNRRELSYMWKITSKETKHYIRPPGGGGALCLDDFLSCDSYQKLDAWDKMVWTTAETGVVIRGDSDGLVQVGFFTKGGSK